MEFDYLLVHMLNRDPSKNELNFYKLGMPGNMETRMIREYPIEFYLKELEKVRTILNENLKDYLLGLFYSYLFVLVLKGV